MNILLLWDCCTLTWLAIGIIALIIGLFGFLASYSLQQSNPNDPDIGEFGLCGIVGCSVGMGMIIAWILVKFI